MGEFTGAFSALPSPDVSGQLSQVFYNEAWQLFEEGPVYTLLEYYSSLKSLKGPSALDDDYIEKGRKKELERISYKDRAWYNMLNEKISSPNVFVEGLKKFNSTKERGTTSQWIKISSQRTSILLSGDVSVLTIKEKERAEARPPGAISPVRRIPPKELGPGDISPEVTPVRTVRKEILIDPIPFELWDTTRYVPWLFSVKKKPLHSVIEAYSYTRGHLQLKDLLDRVIVEKGDKDFTYPFDYQPSYALNHEQSADVILFVLNYLIGLYRSDEFALLYVTSIYAANGVHGEKAIKAERMRQLNVLAGGKIPTTQNGDMVKLDKYEGDWGRLKVIFLLMNMKDQRLIDVTTQSTVSPKEDLEGNHWVCGVFLTGDRQHDRGVFATTTEERVIGMRRMYLIDSFATKVMERPKGKEIPREEFEQADKYLFDRQRVLNRAAWQCYRGGIFSQNIVCTSGWSPKWVQHGPQKATITKNAPWIADYMEGFVSTYGVADFALPTAVVSSSVMRNILYPLNIDRRILVGSIGEKSEKVKNLLSDVRDFQTRLEGRKEGDIKRQAYSLIIESISPNTIHLFETRNIENTLWTTISVIQALLLDYTVVSGDSSLHISERQFAHMTPDFWRAFFRLSSDKAFTKILYTDLVEHFSMPWTYATMGNISPKKSFYTQVNIPALSFTLKTIELIYSKFLQKSMLII